MIISEKPNKTQDLSDLASPEKTAEILKRSYGDPWQELARRKAVALQENHQKNTLFWQAVEAILSPDK